MPPNCEKQAYYLTILGTCSANISFRTGGIDLKIMETPIINAQSWIKVHFEKIVRVTAFLKSQNKRKTFHFNTYLCLWASNCRVS